MGLGGITLALVIILLPQVFILIQRISRYLGLNIAGLLAKTILRSLVPLAAAASLGLLVHAHVVIARRHFVGLLAELGVFAIVYALLAWFFLMTTDDHHDARRFTNSVLSRWRKASARVAEPAAADMRVN
jgi:hypothetical protein